MFSRSPAEHDLARELGAAWVGGYDDPPPEPLDAAVTFAPAGSVVVSALAAVGPAGTVAINAIHLDGIPAFSYDLLWRERVLRSVANFTRADATEFLALAAEIPIRAQTQTFALAEAPQALARLAAGEVQGSAVLLVGLVREHGEPLLRAVSGVPEVTAREEVARRPQPVRANTPSALSAPGAHGSRLPLLSSTASSLSRAMGLVQVCWPCCGPQ